LDNLEDKIVFLVLLNRRCLAFISRNVISSDPPFKATNRVFRFRQTQFNVNFC